MFRMTQKGERQTVPYDAAGVTEILTIPAGALAECESVNGFATREGWCITSTMSESPERLEILESHVAHLERQYEELNQVVIAQGKLLARLQKEAAKISDTMETIEGDRVRATNAKPPHYQ